MKKKIVKHPENIIEMKKKLIEIPINIFEILEKHKKLTGRSTMSMIQESIYRWMIHERLMVIKPIPVYIKNGIVKEKITQSPPQEILYCDSESCTDTPKKGENNLYKKIARL